eukprot:JP443184.1.p1 GENE.JP443184.1~~JP443184.1.p1  ORF type:complete len:75 (+),score=31.68 JP443184.1:24-227(+)
MEIFETLSGGEKLSRDGLANLLQALCDKLGVDEKLTDSEVNDICERADANKDGEINSDELVALLLKA